MVQHCTVLQNMALHGTARGSRSSLPTQLPHPFTLVAPRFPRSCLSISDFPPMCDGLLRFSNIFCTSAIWKNSRISKILMIKTCWSVVEATGSAGAWDGCAAQSLHALLQAWAHPAGAHVGLTCTELTDGDAAKHKNWFLSAAGVIYCFAFLICILISLSCVVSRNHQHDTRNRLLFYGLDTIIRLHDKYKEKLKCAYEGY